MWEEEGEEGVLPTRTPAPRTESAVLLGKSRGLTAMRRHTIPHMAMHVRRFSHRCRLSLCTPGVNDGDGAGLRRYTGLGDAVKIMYVANRVHRRTCRRAAGTIPLACDRTCMHARMCAVLRIQLAAVYNYMCAQAPVRVRVR